MVFIPVRADEARALRAGEPLKAGSAYAATEALRATFDYGADEDEDANFAAQVFASLRCLVDGFDRCLLAAESAVVPVATGESTFGEVAPPDVRWRDVRAIFIGESGSATYAESARGRTLSDLWADDATHTFLADHDLLWFDPTELDQALAGLGDSPTKGD